MGLDLYKEYEYLMNLRDLNWVRQLMLEKQLLDRPVYQEDTSGLLPDDIPWQLLEDVRTVIRRAEAAVFYLKRWCQLLVPGADFDKVEMFRRRGLPQSHPCNLIRPYLIMSGAWEDQG